MSTTITLKDVDADIAAEQTRHDARMAELKAIRRYFIEKEKTATSPMGPKEQSAVSPIYGAKKRFILTSIAHAPDGLTSPQVIALAKVSQWPNSTLENTVPQLSMYKSDKLLDQKDGRWTITAKGRDYITTPKD